MGRRFGSRVPADNETLVSAHRHPSEGNPSHGIPAYPDPLPGEHHYAETDPVQRHALAVPPNKPYYAAGMAHGVESPQRYDGRAVPRHEDRTADATEAEAFPELGDWKEKPIPVYIVEVGGGSRPLRSASPISVPVPAAGSRPVQLCGKDSSRVRVMLLNESSSSNVRFASNPGSLAGGSANGSGALLPWPMNSYLALHTQDELWAVSADSGTPYVSVVQEFEIQGAG